MNNSDNNEQRENNAQQESTEYGWRENAPPAPQKQGSGSRIIFVVAGVLLIAVGLFLLFGFGKSHIRSFGTGSDALLESRINLANSRVDEISLSAAVAEVSIIGHNSDELDIRIEMNNDIVYKITPRGNSIIIDTEGNIRFPNSNRVTSDKIFISVPFSYDGDFTIELAAGTANVSGIGGDCLTVKMAAGEFLLSDVGYDELRIEMAAGQLRMNNVSCDEFDLEMAAGALTGKNISAKDINIKATAGGIDLSGDLGKTDCEIAAASLMLDYNAMPRSIEIESTAGSADIYLPEGSEFRLKSTIVMGSVFNDFATNPNSSNEISITMAMGQAKIHKK